MFDPKVTCYPFPEYTDRHYLVVKKNDGTVFDKHYPYINTSRGFRFRRALLRAATVVVAFPICTICQGLVIKGRENLKKYEKELSGGCVTVSNHIHMLDYISVMRALYPRKTNIIAWARNISGENGPLIRLVGGIPVPENDIRATGAFTATVIDYLNQGGWLHICAEGSMWEYYQPIRPFKQGTSFFAVKTGKPVLPIAFSYREPKGIAKLIYRKAMITLTIGEPLFPDMTKAQDEAIEDLTIRTHDAICRLAGIDPAENLYPPIFNNSKRVDYYTTEYGKKAKNK